MRLQKCKMTDHSYADELKRRGLDKIGEKLSHFNYQKIVWPEYVVDKEHRRGNEDKS